MRKVSESSKVIRLVTSLRLVQEVRKRNQLTTICVLGLILACFFAGQPAASILSQVKVVKIKAGISILCILHENGVHPENSHEGKNSISSAKIQQN